MFALLENAPKLGYQLYDFGSRWEIHSTTCSFKGNFDQVKTYAVANLGFSSEEILVAVEEMSKQFHNAAEFGVLKKFMFTFEKVEKREKFHRIH